MENTEEKTIIIDVPSALSAHKKKTGKRQTITAEAAENGVTTQTIANWELKAPPAVAFVYNFCKKYNIAFEELVKEIKRPLL